ncbi:putative F-box domain-containing protein [Tanacetum coccineum]
MYLTHPEIETMASSIPDEILRFRILPRLPGIYVYRFKCVSKQWQLTLTSEKFKKLHTDEHQKHHKLVVISRTEDCTFNTIDCEAPHNGLTPSRPIPFNANPRDIEILTSFHGLVCVGIVGPECDDIYTDLILWNPLTAEYKTLSRANSHRDCYKTVGKAFGLYYTSFDKDYKLVCVTDPGDVYIYSLKSDSWRKVDSVQHIPNDISERWKLSTNRLNENLYFLKQDRNVCPNSYPIIKFDTKTEKFINIATPSIDDEYSNRATLMVQRGCVYFCIKYGIGDVGFINMRFELWKMNEDGSWKNVATYQRKPYDVCFLKPLHLMRNGNLLMVSGFFYNGDRGYLYQVDPKKKKHSKGKDISKWRTLVTRGLSEEVRYIETFVSPNQYIN